MVCLVPDLAAAELGVDGKAAELRNTASVVDALEVHRPGPFAVDLDDEDAELLGLCLRAFDLRQHGVPVPRSDRGEVRLDVLVCKEGGQEVDVIRPGSTDGDGHAGSPCARGPRIRRPEASATPPRINTRPPSAAAVTGSSRIVEP